MRSAGPSCYPRCLGQLDIAVLQGGNGILDGILGGSSPQASTQQETLSESDFFMFCFKVRRRVKNLGLACVSFSFTGQSMDLS